MGSPLCDRQMPSSCNDRTSSGLTRTASSKARTASRRRPVCSSAFPMPTRRSWLSGSSGIARWSVSTAWSHSRRMTSVSPRLAREMGRPPDPAGRLGGTRRPRRQTGRDRGGRPRRCCVLARVSARVPPHVRRPPALLRSPRRRAGPPKGWHGTGRYRRRSRSPAGCIGRLRPPGHRPGTPPNPSRCQPSANPGATDTTWRYRRSASGRRPAWWWPTASAIACCSVISPRQGRRASGGSPQTTPAMPVSIGAPT